MGTAGIWSRTGQQRSFYGAFLLAALMLFVAQILPAQTADRTELTMRELEARAELFVRDMFAARLFEARSQMSDQLRRTMSDAAIRQMFGDLLMTSGKLERVGHASAVVREDGAVIAQLPVELAQTNLIAYIVFERPGPLARIVSFNFKPERDVPIEERPAKPVEDPGPPYANKALFKEEVYRLEIGERTLPAILTLPTIASESTSVPGVLLINAGWGLDADGSTKFLSRDSGTTESLRPEIVHAKINRDLAHGLASRGIAVLRYADRLNENPEFIETQYGLDDLVLHDAIAAAKVLRQQPKVDAAKLIIVGIDLGGFIAPLVADTSKAASTALLRPWPIDIESGFQQNDGETSTSLWTSAFAPHLQSERFWYDLDRTDPAAVLLATNRPFAIFHSDARARDWNEAVSKSSFKGVSREYVGLNALFIAEGARGPFAYVDERVVKDLAAFARTGRLAN